MKHHLITDRHRTPLALPLTSANPHDITQLMPSLDAIPHIRAMDRPRHRPRRRFPDRGYNYDKYRRLLPSRRTTPNTARKSTAHGSALSKTSHIVERTLFPAPP
ncbi:transposase, partial [Streptomyces virginiae]|uniref:transposase n=1 Tax=Streptomyces virginiae TaxID=1961 RepID=UPI003D8005FA